MTRSTVFTSNRGQAVRLPEPVAFPAGVHRVDVIKLGAGRLIVPVGKRWDDVFERGPRVSADFMSDDDRNQPIPERREDL